MHISSPTNPDRHHLQLYQNTHAVISAPRTRAVSDGVASVHGNHNEQIDVRAQERRQP